MECETCKGKRLNEKALSIFIRDKNISDVTAMSVQKLNEWFNDLELTETESIIGERILKEIRERLKFLKDVGLEYLTLARSAGTLSGGESQRIRLATQIGSGLVGVVYVLDEPSIGLHQRDNEKLLNALRNLTNLGNTLIGSTRHLRCGPVRSSRCHRRAHGYLFRAVCHAACLPVLPQTHVPVERGMTPPSASQALWRDDSLRRRRHGWIFSEFR